MKELLICIVCTCLIHQVQAQGKERQYPEVGKPCPDFTFHEVQYYKNKSVTMADFAGKWLVLDCWNAHCSVCLDRMPQIDSMQKSFDSQVTFLLVGYTGSQYVHKGDNESIRRIYELNRNNRKLDLAIAYDSLLFHRFAIGPCPYMIIIDPGGVVRGITSHIQQAQLDSLIKHKEVTLRKAYRKGERYREKLTSPL